MSSSSQPPKARPKAFVEGEWDDQDTFTGSTPMAARWAQVVAATNQRDESDLALPTPLEIGQRIGQYELVTRLAKGGMAYVWMAWRRRSNGKAQVIALKTLLPSLVHERGFVHMFLDEAKLLSEIRHTNVVAIHDVGVYQETPYVALEWVEGDTLSSLLRAVSGKGNEIPLAIALRVVGECCLGLHNAHELRNRQGELLNVVHRDVSPSNIMVSSHGDVKLIDFGVAKATERLAEQTRTGVLKGKVSYMAPEQILRAEPDRRTDVWAAGVVLYRLIAQRMPYEGSIPRVVQQIKAGEPVPALPATTPRAVSEIVHQALQRNPQQRFQTAAEMRRAIQYAYAEVCAPVPKKEFARYVMSHLGGTIRSRRTALETALRRAKP